MKLSNVIEEWIKEMMSESDGKIELRRNELANMFHCVPSQINYVISTRFSPERGYIVESQRGGGGYIKITRVLPKGGGELMHVVNMIGESLNFEDCRVLIQNCYDYDLINEKEARIILAAVGKRSLPIKQPEQDVIRAGLFKNMLLALV